MGRLPACTLRKRSYINSESKTLFQLELMKSKYLGTSYSVLSDTPDPQFTCCPTQSPDGHGHKAHPY